MYSASLGSEGAKGTHRARLVRHVRERGVAVGAAAQGTASAAIAAWPALSEAEPNARKKVWKKGRLYALYYIVRAIRARAEDVGEVAVAFGRTELGTTNFQTEAKKLV